MAKKCRIYETLGSITGMQLESLENNEVRLSGVFGVCGVKNNNNRVYSKENYGAMVESLQKTIQSDKAVLGELEHPNSMNINLNNVSHCIESIEMHEDGTVTGTIKLLDTEKGRNAKAIVEAGVPLYISSRAMGSIDESGNVTLQMLKTYDLVGTPGFSQASLHLNDDQKFESLNESLCVVYEGEEEPKKDDETKEDDEPKKEDKDNKDKDKATMTDLKDSVDKLSEKVEQLSAELHVAQESINEKNEEIQALTEQIESLKPTNYEAIQSWIEEEFAPEYRNKICEGMQDWVNTEFAPVIEKWITEEYSGELQKWITEEYSGELQKWITEEYSGELQKWITEEYSENLNEWITEHFTPELEKKINENVSAFFESQKDNKFENIDRMLESLSVDNSADKNIQMLKEMQEKNLGKYANIYAIANMPNEYRPMFETLSDEKKDAIALQSRAYDFTKNGVLESFWANVDFSKATPINENKTPESMPNNFMSSIAQQMLSMRGF
jgi:macrodomain Ter protein organizer (MatP/YcbG family)